MILCSCFDTICIVKKRYINKGDLTSMEKLLVHARSQMHVTQTHKKKSIDVVWWSSIYCALTTPVNNEPLTCEKALHHFGFILINRAALLKTIMAFEQVQFISTS